VSVLALSLVTIILGLGLGLGLQLQSCRNEVVQHCRGRCYEPFDPEVSGCRCDADCTANDNCCYDYHDVGLEAQGGGVGEVGGAEEVQTGQQLHISDPG
ncbi:hypothetical protein CRUP_008310, partial [Coryphaenoides rupestris]